MNEISKVADAFKHLAVENLGAGIPAGGFASIGIKGQRWSLKYQGESYPFVREDDGSPLTYLDVVIIKSNEFTSKLYFGDGTYTEESAAGPICASLKADVPDPGVPDPQHPNCPNCPKNQYGSGPGGKSKACQDNTRVAVMLMPKMTAKMLGAPLFEPVFFKVPPASRKTFKAYGDYLQHQGIPYQAVQTRMWFNPEKNWEILFKRQEYLTDKAAEHVLPLITNPTTLQILGQPSIVALSAPEPLAASNEIEEAFTVAAAPKLKAIVKAVEPEIEAPVKRGRGRPPGATNKPKQIEAQAVEANGQGNDDWVTPSTPEMDETIKQQMDVPETDSAISPETQALLGKKMHDFLKE